jgi:hypothetical protein
MEIGIISISKQTPSGGNYTELERFTSKEKRIQTV